jgi:hypothetical protein
MVRALADFWFPILQARELLKVLGLTHADTSIAESEKDAATKQLSESCQDSKLQNNGSSGLNALPRPPMLTIPAEPNVC